MGRLKVGNKTIKYNIKHTNSKYAHLRFREDLQLEVKLPYESSVKPKDLISTKRDWIEKTYQKLIHSEKVLDKNKLLYKGKSYNLKTIKSNNKIRITEDTITIGLKDETNLNQAVKKWMTTETRKYVKRKIKFYEKKLGVKIKDIDVTEAKKWGHCTQDKKLVFNWQLIALPKDLADFIILHEITHLSEFSHNHQFNTKLFSLCPDFKEKEESLRNISPIPK